MIFPIAICQEQAVLCVFSSFFSFWSLFVFLLSDNSLRMDLEIGTEQILILSDVRWDVFVLFCLFDSDCVCVRACVCARMRVCGFLSPFVGVWVCVAVLLLFGWVGERTLFPQ